MSANGQIPTAAVKMAASVEDSLERGGMGSRRSLYFNPAGKRLLEQYERDDGKGGRRPAAPPKNPAFVIEYPFRPSIASLTDMVAEHAAVGGPVVYGEERWELDPRVDQQIAEAFGPDLAEDWQLERLLDKLGVEDEKVAA